MRLTFYRNCLQAFATLFIRKAIKAGIDNIDCTLLHTFVCNCSFFFASYLQKAIFSLLLL